MEILKDHASLAATLLGIASVGFALLLVAGPIVGDLDGDSDVNINDLNQLLAALGQQVTAGDPRDLDGDGVITVLDGRQLANLCTLPLCVRPTAATPTPTSIPEDQDPANPGPTPTITPASVAPDS